MEVCGSVFLKSFLKVLSIYFMERRTWLTPSRLDFQTCFWVGFPLKMTKTRKVICFFY